MTAGSPLQTGQAAAQEEAIPGAAPGQDRKPDHQPGDHGRPSGGQGYGPCRPEAPQRTETHHFPFLDPQPEAMEWVRPGGKGEALLGA